MSIEVKHIGGIEVWSGGYDDICTDKLSESQKKDIECLRSDKHRRERTLTYTLINYAARSNYDEFAFIEGATIGHYANGAPFLEVEMTANISISHCRTGACIAISRSAECFGIDIEDESEKLLRVKEKFINKEEDAIIGDELLLTAWTIKEAVYKAALTPGLALRDGIRIEWISEGVDNEKGTSVLEAKILVGTTKYSAVCFAEGSRCMSVCCQNCE